MPIDKKKNKPQKYQCPKCGSDMVSTQCFNDRCGYTMPISDQRDMKREALKARADARFDTIINLLIEIKERLPVCVCDKHNDVVYDEWYEWWCPVHGKRRI